MYDMLRRRTHFAKRSQEHTFFEWQYITVKASHILHVERKAQLAYTLCNAPRIKSLR